jgi:hypothetical protein
VGDSLVGILQSDQREDIKQYRVRNRSAVWQIALDGEPALIDKPWMKLRHAAEVALAGWFLITPPPQSNGHYDTSAPLGGAGTSEQCKETQALLSARAIKADRPSDIVAIKHGRCVSMDDPRLEGE